MTPEEQSRMVDKWVGFGKPEIPLWHGMFVGDLPKFLAHCIKTDQLDAISQVLRFLMQFDPQSPGITHTSAMTDQRSS